MPDSVFEGFDPSLTPIPFSIYVLRELTDESNRYICGSVDLVLGLLFRAADGRQGIAPESAASPCERIGDK